MAVKDSVFTINRYSTPFLKVDLYYRKVLGYGGYSKTDSSHML